MFSPFRLGVMALMPPTGCELPAACSSNLSNSILFSRLSPLTLVVWTQEKRSFWATWLGTHSYRRSLRLCVAALFNRSDWMQPSLKDIIGFNLLLEKRLGGPTCSCRATGEPGPLRKKYRRTEKRAQRKMYEKSLFDPLCVWTFWTSRERKGPMFYLKNQTYYTQLSTASTQGGSSWRNSPPGKPASQGQEAHNPHLTSSPPLHRYTGNPLAANLTARTGCRVERKPKLQSQLKITFWSNVQIMSVGLMKSSNIPTLCFQGSSVGTGTRIARTRCWHHHIFAGAMFPWISSLSLLSL